MPGVYRLLTINCGSSSLKAALYLMGQAETLVLSVKAERIGLAGSRLAILDAAGKSLADLQTGMPDHDAALRALFDWLQAQGYDKDLDAVGHRVVHGGKEYTRPQLVTSPVVETLQRLVPLAPDHLPQAIKAIEAA